MTTIQDILDWNGIDPRPWTDGVGRRAIQRGIVREPGGRSDWWSPRKIMMGSWPDSKAPNRILVEFRRCWWHDRAGSMQIELDWLREPGAHPVPMDATPEEMAHARAVYSRWLAVCG